MHPDLPTQDTNPSERARRASSFGTDAASYAEHRPNYPQAGVEWALAPVRTRSPLRVLDLAAGTGKLTEGLVALNLDVLAVEPDKAMLAELNRMFPSVPGQPGTAEDIPLPAESVDAVLVGQAMHWFDLDKALPEIARVLRPGGVLAALWNRDDDRVDWVARFCEVSGAVRRSAVIQHAPDPRPWFDAFDKAEFPHRQRRTKQTLVATIATYSRMLVLPPAERAEKLAEVAAYLDGQPETAAGSFDLPMTTLVLRTARR